MKARAALLVSVAAALVACRSQSSPDAGPGIVDVRDGGVAADVMEPDDTGPRRDATQIIRDLGVIIVHDAGAPQTCTVTCDCPQGLACLDGVCKTAGVGPVWCCDNPGCPSSSPCVGRSERPGTCPAPPDAGPDAGPRDIGAGSIGSECMSNADCDMNTGLTCYSEFRQPFLWNGYCTKENCNNPGNGCPLGSICVQDNNMTFSLCMTTCLQASECRASAYCRAIGGASVCWPNCVDDLVDCPPWNGSRFCNRQSGQCDIATMQSPGTSVGASCADNRGCGVGQVCLGTHFWGLFGLNANMCTRVCNDGAGNITPCGQGETCQTLAGVGLCFPDCDAQMMCPNRVGATCRSLAGTWPNPSCVP